jgi:hypothetical protein
MSNTAKVRSLAVLFATLCLSLAATAQNNCPMGMQTRNVVGQFSTLGGKGICHLRLWDDQTNWIDLEPSNGVYNWTNLDNFLSEAQAQGFDVLYTFGKVPGWASSNPTDPNCKDGYHAGDCAPPSDVNSGDAYFKAFVTALMAHVGTQISYFEMWDEPYNLPYWDGTPQELAILTADAAQIIRAANPQALILTPSIGPYKNQQAFLATFFAACVGNVTFDVFDLHDYTWGGPPENVISEVQQVIAFQKAQGMQSLPLWSSEGSDKNWATFDQQTKNDYIARYLTLELSLGSQRHYWYSWNTSTVGGLVNTPGATVYATVASWLTNRTPKGCGRTPVNGGYRYVCTVQDTTAHPIVWVTVGSTTFTTTASEYQDNLGVTYPVVGGSVPINDSPIFILQ